MKNTFLKSSAIALQHIKNSAWAIKKLYSKNMCKKRLFTRNLHYNYDGHASTIFTLWYMTSPSETTLREDKSFQLHISRRNWGK